MLTKNVKYKYPPNLLFNMTRIAVDDSISIHPERIYTRKELEVIIAKIDEFEKTLGCKGGVVLRQNLNLGGSYVIRTEQQALEGIAHREGSEFYVKYYPKEYFEELRQTLQ